jgi:hypothetical protein
MLRSLSSAIQARSAKARLRRRRFGLAPGRAALKFA